MSASSDVLIYDSGVGGLSVSQEISQRLPFLKQLYVSDNAAFPYGIKEHDWLIRRVEAVLQQVLSRSPVKMLVMACNTASTVVLPSLRQKLQIPVVGVVPAIKPAAQMSRLKKIALIATPATIKRAYTDELIANYAHDCHVLKIGSSRLVEIAEEKLRGHVINKTELQQILSPLLHDGHAQVDVAILGCTHFPLLRQEFIEHVAQDIQWIDSGAAIARRVAEILKVDIATGGGKSAKRGSLVMTKPEADIVELQSTFRSFGFDSIEILDCSLET
ncbi:MAG: glutamate racemase [Oligoflexus sp.]